MCDYDIDGAFFEYDILFLFGHSTNIQFVFPGFRLAKWIMFSALWGTPGSIKAFQFPAVKHIGWKVVVDGRYLLVKKYLIVRQFQYFISSISSVNGEFSSPENTG